MNAPNFSNIKDTLTTICSFVTVVGGAMVTAQLTGQLHLPETVLGILGAAVVIATALTQFLTGKTPAGTTKTTEQVIAGNEKP